MLKPAGKHRIVLMLLVSLFQVVSAQSFLEKAEQSQNLDSSIIYAEQHLAQLKNKGKESVATVYFLARKLITASRYVKAEKILLEALQWPVVQKSDFERARLELGLGGLYKYKEDYSESLIHYLKALELLQSGEHPKELMTCYIDLAEYYRSLRKFDKAKGYIDRALTLYKDKKLSDDQLIRAYHRAAAIANERGEANQSIAYSRKALELARESGKEYSQAVSLNELGFTYKNAYKLDSALDYYRGAEKLFFKSGAYREAVHTMNNRAMLYVHSQYPPDQILQLYKQIIDTVNRYDVDYPLLEVYRYVHHVYADRNDSAAAYRYFLKYHSVVIDEERRKNDIAVTNIIEKYENEKVKREIEEVSDQLEESHKETTRMLIFLVTSGIFLFVIGFLAFRLNTSNRKLKERNKEKDVLIQEIHHRVKNNLQIVSSLLELQTKKTDDASANSIMMEAQNRVKTMALIHKKLYQNDNLEQVDFQGYLEDLCASLYQIYKTMDMPVQHEIDAKGTYFDIDTAVPLGLIVNELVTNAYKYAFKNIPNPKLKVGIDRAEKGTYTLTVSDNGPGLSKDIESLTKSSLGLRLVGRLAKQLSGKLTYTSNGINNFIVTFQDTMTRKQIE